MSLPETDIIIIKGAPATGKSQTAKELANYFVKGVRLEVDNLRSMVISVDWTNQTEHINILEISTKLTSEFYNMGFKPIIIVETFSGNKIHSFYESLKTINPIWTIGIFGLFSSEIELQNRLQMRKDDKFKDFLITRKLNEDTIKFKHQFEYQIDTTDLKSEETAKIIYDKLLQPST